MDVDAALDDFYSEITGSTTELDTVKSSEPLLPDDTETKTSRMDINTNHLELRGISSSLLAFCDYAEAKGSEEQVIPDTVCIVCRRLLPTKEALDKHYTQSRLHAVLYPQFSFQCLKCI